MIEETKVEETKVEETKVEEKEVVVVEPSPVEVEATEQGWVSKEEWEAAGRDPSEHRSAKEFVDRGELYKSLHSLKRDLKQTQAAHTALQRHHQYIFEKAHKQALEDLKREKRVAIRNEDLETAETIAEEMETLKEQHEKEKQIVAEEAQKAQTSAPNPEFQQWVEKNPWYSTDMDLREFADATAIVYINKNTSSTPASVLKHVETSLRKNFPDKFGAKKAAPNAVVGVDRTNSKAKPVMDIELDDFEREIMRQLVSSGEMTETQYKSELKKAKGIK